jgi:hypothetical protein
MAREDRYQIPKWFDLEKYKSLVKLCPKGWAYQLYVRHHLYFSLLDKCTVCGEVCCKNDDRLEFEAQLNSVMLEPVKESTEYFSIDPEPHFCEKHTLPGLRYISPTTREMAKKAPMKASHGSRDDPISFESSYEDYMETDGIFDAQSTNLSKSNGIVFLNADLNANDEVLVDEFKLYLKHVREYYGFQEGNLKSSSIVKKLTKSGVLPFLDLKIYSRFVQIDRIKNHSDDYVDYPYYIYGDWIFPNEQIDRVDKIRRTTKPLAERAVTFHFIGVLANLPT